MGWEFPGSENKSRAIKFRFACDDAKCDGHISNGGFRAKMHEVPDIVPSGCPCPFGGDHEAKWIIDSTPAVHVRGGEMSTHDYSNPNPTANPHYDAERADQEHRWMESQIEEAKKSLRGEDQLTGKAASPYGKWTLNKEEALKRGVIKKASQEQSEERNRIMDERSKIVMDQASDKLTDIERQHAGRRHDG
tara:strand:- start:382 stop:954 length:573 start_codon:yes stop_codon:yes gene_type:complete